MKLWKKIKKLYSQSSLAAKIRISYVTITVPVLVLLIVAIILIYRTNTTYDKMIESVVSASGFSLDFKSDIDYETYLVVAGVKSYEASDIEWKLKDAKETVYELKKITDNPENISRLDDISKYLENIDGYILRIRKNLSGEGTYEDSMSIWENDVQVVTSLLEETFNQYIYYEVKALQVEKDGNLKTFKLMSNVLVILVILTLIIILVLSYYTPRGISEPVRKLISTTDRVASGDLSVRADISSGAEMLKLSDSINTMIEHINTLLEQVKQEQISLRKAEFLLLQSQINPHFLYNTLDAIIWLSESGKSDEAVRLVGYLSSFFRTSLGHGEDIVTLKDEMDHIKSYLDIQCVRYVDILHYEIDIPEGLYEAKIPKITLQPLVENALYHGIKNKRGGGTIKVQAEITEDDAIEVSVLDDGAGISKERLDTVREGIVKRSSKETGVYGLYNVNERIRLYFGDEYGLKIESRQGEYTRSVIVIPGIIKSNSS